MADPLVTIIMPGRDIEEFAPAALGSLTAQTEHRWRALLIDDGSEDSTGRIFDIAAANDPRFTVLHNRFSVGLGAARNQGLALIDTPYLGFLDADDEFAPESIQRTTQTLARTGSDLVVSAYVRLRPRDTKDERGSGEPAHDVTDYVAGRVQPWVRAATDPARDATTLSAHPQVTGNIVAWSKVSRSEFWADRRFPEGVAYEDQVVAQQMYVEARAFDVIPDATVRWRLRADQSSITQGKGSLSVLRDYLAGLAGGIRILVDAGESAAVLARLTLILSMDLPSLETVAARHPDPEYRVLLDEFVTGLARLPEFSQVTPDPDMVGGLAL